MSVWSLIADVYLFSNVFVISIRFNYMWDWYAQRFHITPVTAHAHFPFIYRTYSRKNCEMECESRVLIEFCGCVLYYMPRVDVNTNICNRDDWTCYEEIKKAVELASNDTYQCNCLPGCFEISYGADISTARLGTGGFMIKQNIIKELGTPDYITYQKWNGNFTIYILT